MAFSAEVLESAIDARGDLVWFDPSRNQMTINYRKITEDGVLDDYELELRKFLREQGVKYVNRDDVLTALRRYARRHEHIRILEIIEQGEYRHEGHLAKLMNALELDDTKAAIFTKTLLNAYAKWADKMPVPQEIVPILSGKQGCGKTRLWRYLFFSDEYIKTEGSLALDEATGTAKDSSMLLARYNAMELSEFGGTLDRVNALKKCITAPFDTFRPPYGRGIIDMRRYCFLVGSVNEKPEDEGDGVFIDATGNRRFLYIQFPNRKITSWREIFDSVQLWKEIREMWECRFDGVTWHLTPEEEAYQEADNKTHALKPRAYYDVESYLQRHINAPGADRIISDEVRRWIKSEFNRDYSAKDIAQSLKAHGYVVKPGKIGGRSVRYYVVDYTQQRKD